MIAPAIGRFSMRAALITIAALAVLLLAAAALTPAAAGWLDGKEEPR